MDASEIFAAIAKLAGGAGKPHGTTIVAVSWTAGVPDNQLMFTEYASSADEYVFEQQWIWDSIMSGLNGGNEAGTGGALREMGEIFQESYDKNKGDLTKTMQDFAAVKKTQGQGKPAKKVK